MAEPLTLYKLIILYMLKKVDFPLTNAQISEFVLDQEYTTYFSIYRMMSLYKVKGSAIVPSLWLKKFPLPGATQFQLPVNLIED